MKDIFIVDHITKISQTQVSPIIIEDFNITIKNLRMWRNNSMSAMMDWYKFWKKEERKRKVRSIFNI
jgi:hypothetical protein